MSIYNSVRGAIERVGAARRRRRDYDKLNAMDDRQLYDIGLTRGDIMAGFARRRSQFGE
ncbi:DUF1127 domain-containing protein [Hoeflea sp. WL0058]|uniref:DUF1127 domain-containing protein n=1 Tax=Flavimaribacter sediminis TaxID=2865987 RepID=A0AAE2ZNJ1_9HYPH|nr:DUF1127 domain-containing protein [Flavimaribacter sediminis]MBW8640189.1 DUF1127 domain-containing protein [Flavimaribacter sediminis]